MKYILCYREEPLGVAWRRYFSERSDVKVVTGDICRLACDAIVSPANSFGFMDGGLDHQISDYFGWELQDQVQKAIRARPMRELLIGEAIIVSTNHARVPWLVVAPTMRVPMRIRTAINAYLAMKAILIAMREHSHEIPIESVAISGLGTGIGQLSPEVCAAQMWQAFREIVMGEQKDPGSFGEAQKMHAALNRSAMLYD